MRTLIVCAAGALALAACQQPAAPEAEAPAAADTAADASAEATGEAAAPSGGAAQGGAAAPSDTSTDAGASPAGDGMMAGPSPETRDAAKEKAEQTNLHPKA